MGWCCGKAYDSDGRFHNKDCSYLLNCMRTVTHQAITIPCMRIRKINNNWSIVCLYCPKIWSRISSFEGAIEILNFHLSTYRK